MKVLVLALLLLCGATCFAQDAKVETTYDRFKNVTSVETSYDLAQPVTLRNVQSIVLGASFRHKGERLVERPRVFYVAIGVRSDTWEFTRRQSPSLIILADGKKVFDGNADKIDMQVKSGYVLESFLADFDLTLVEQIVKAQLVEMQLGTVEFRLTSANINALRALLAASSPS